MKILYIIILIFLVVIIVLSFLDIPVNQRAVNIFLAVVGIIFTLEKLGWIA